MVIMVCYDGSATARRAVRLAQEHAAVWNAEMIVVKAMERELPLKRAYIEKEEHKLEVEIGDILGGHQIPYECQLFISSMSPGEQLVNFARSQYPDSGWGSKTFQLGSPRNASFTARINRPPRAPSPKLAVSLASGWNPRHSLA